VSTLGELTRSLLKDTGLSEDQIAAFSGRPLVQNGADNSLAAGFDFGQSVPDPTTNREFGRTSGGATR